MCGDNMRGRRSLSYSLFSVATERSFEALASVQQNEESCVIPCILFCDYLPAPVRPHLLAILGFVIILQAYQFASAMSISFVEEFPTRALTVRRFFWGFVIHLYNFIVQSQKCYIAVLDLEITL